MINCSIDSKCNVYLSNRILKTAQFIVVIPSKVEITLKKELIESLYRIFMFPMLPTRNDSLVRSIVYVTAVYCTNPMLCILL